MASARRQPGRHGRSTFGVRQRSHVRPFGSSLAHATAFTIALWTPSLNIVHAEVIAPAATGSLEVANAETPSADDEIAQGKFALAPGDRLSIVVFEQPDVSGTYFVEPDGNVTLPLLGAITVTGMTTQVLQHELRTRLAAGYIQNPLVSVRLTELRPVTVIGQVRSPGRYTFIDGMNLEILLALAGGPSALNTEDIAMQSDFLQSDERLKSLRINYLGQLARRARLKAQLTGGKMEFPDIAPEEEEVLRKLTDGEQQILDAETASQDRQAAVLREQAHQIAADIAALEEQSALEIEQGKFLDTQIADLQRLVVNGLTKKSALLEMQREKNKSRANLAIILGNLSRSKSLLAETDLRLQDLETTYRSRIMADIQSNALQIADTESVLPIAAEMRKLKLARLPAGTTGEAPSKMTIRRFRDGEIQTIQADAATEVWPGDLVQIGGGGKASAPVTPGPDAMRDFQAPPAPPQSGDRLSLR